MNDTIEELKLKSRSDESDNKTNVNVFGEKTIHDRLIVFDDVSGLADESKTFIISFLTVARKYNYNCVNIFHMLYPEKSIWRTILSQTKIFNIFPATVSINSIKKILENACIQKTSKYIPQTSLWISRPSVELANRNDKVCLTLDCTNTNKDGPGRFRTEAENPDCQLCYFHSANDEQVYNKFASKRMKSNSSENNFHFKIVELKSKTNKDISFNTSEELHQLNKNDTKTSRLLEEERRHLPEQEKEKLDYQECLQTGGVGYPISTAHILKNPLQKTMESLEKELNQNIYSSDNVIKKIPKKEIK